MSDSVRPHIRQPTRLPRAWDSPSKNTGVGCHFLLQCMRVKSESEVAQSCPTLCDPMVCSLPGSSVHGISRQEYWSGLPLPSPKNNTTSNKKRPPGVCPKCKKGFHWLNECRSKFDKDGNALTTEAQQKQQLELDMEQ